MTFLCATFSILLSLISASWAAEPEVIPPGGFTDSAALQEATRVLEEEIKLAAKPQTYVLIDLATNVIQIKGRGVELHRSPIESWSASDLSRLAALHRLRERPQVTRRKIDPTAVAEQDPISLVDMPTTFTLKFSPPWRSSFSPIRMAIPGNGPCSEGEYGGVGSRHGGRFFGPEIRLRLLPPSISPFCPVTRSRSPGRSRKACPFSSAALRHREALCLSCARPISLC